MLRVDFAKPVEGVWERLYREHEVISISRTNRIIFNRVRRHISFRGKSILQIGSGPGVFSLMAAEEAKSIALLDRSEEALKQAKRLFADVQIPVQYYRTDILEEADPPGMFDIVVSEGLVEHFKPSDLLRVLTRHRQCVSPDGEVIVIVPASPHWNDVRCRAPFSRRHYGWQRPISKGRMSLFFKEAGLAIRVNEKFCATYGVFHFPGCRYLHRIVEFPIESDHPLDRFFGGLLLTIGKPHSATIGKS